MESVTKKLDLTKTLHLQVPTHLSRKSSTDSLLWHRLWKKIIWFMTDSDCSQSSLHTKRQTTITLAKFRQDFGNSNPTVEGPLVAFHPRPQIAGDLGHVITCSSNSHRNRKRFPRRNETSAYGHRFRSQRAEWESQAPPLRMFAVVRTPQIANPHAAIAELGPPGGCKSQNRRPPGH